MEIKYVKCVKSGTSDFTIGKIYNWPNPVDDTGDVRQIRVLSGSVWAFDPSTEEAYDAQEIITTDYIPKIGDYVIMEKAGGWGYHPANNGCVAIVNNVRENRVDGIKAFSIWGEVINPNINKVTKFSDVPQFGYGREVIFRKALPHEISNITPKTEPQQVEGWEEITTKITSPTEAISDESPLDICRKRYKKGMKVKSPLESGMFSGEFIINVDPSKFYYTGGDGVDYHGSEGWLYINGKFAEILDEPKEPILPKSVEINTEMDKGSIINKLRLEAADLIEHPLTPSDAVFSIKNKEKQIRRNKFQEVHEIKTVEEKLLRKTKSKLFNI